MMAPLGRQASAEEQHGREGLEKVLEVLDWMGSELKKPPKTRLNEKMPFELLFPTWRLLSSLASFRPHCFS